MASHQVQKVVDVHLVGLVGLSELLEVDILLVVLDDLRQCEVLYEEVVERVFLGELELFVDVLGEGAEDSLEVFDAHELFFIVHHKELRKMRKGVTKGTLMMNWMMSTRAASRVIRIFLNRRNFYQFNFS